MATAFDSPTSSPAAAPFRDDAFLHFDASADVHASADGFPPSPDPYAFRSDAPSPFGMPQANGAVHDDPFAAADSNGGPILPPPTEMGRDEGFLLREWRRSVTSFPPCFRCSDPAHRTARFSEIYASDRRVPSNNLPRSHFLR
jgi:hypothetical protein